MNNSKIKYGSKATDTLESKIQYTRSNPLHKEITHELGFNYIQRMWQNEDRNGTIWWNMIPFNEEEQSFLNYMKNKARTHANRKQERLYE